MSGHPELVIGAASKTSFDCSQPEPQPFTLLELKGIYGNLQQDQLESPIKLTARKLLWDPQGGGFLLVFL